MSLKIFKKKDETKPVIVTTKEQLNAALEKNVDCIEVRGDLAQKVKRMKMLTSGKVVALMALIPITMVSTTATPATMCLTMPAIISITGTEIAAIIAALGLSLVALSAIYKGYDCQIEHNGTKVLLVKRQG